MKTIFDKTTRDELIKRINGLSENNTPQWGKMNIGQMLRHCALWEEMALGKKMYKHTLLGRLFGKMVLKDFLKDDRPLKRNLPSIPEIMIKENVDGNITSEKRKWIALIEEYENFSKPGFVHPFFGKMTKEQTGYLAYKHTDHHLQQFNA